MHLKTLPPEAIAPIRARFLLALRDRETRLRDAVRPPSTGFASGAMCLQLAEDIHKIRGVAPMLGMPDLGARAADAEDRLARFFDSAAQGATDPRLPEDLHACLHALHSAVVAALDRD